MPLHCVGERRSPSQLDDDDDEELGECTSIWQEAPDSLLLHVFSFLHVTDLALVAQTCKVWSRISYDESLWRNILRSSLKLTDCVLAAGKSSWRQEVKRIQHHTPLLLTETLTEHTDEVLHISFSHNGSMFSTTSKDATLKVWSVGYPTTLKYSKDFRELLGWDFTQFSCFNESDTMILVSSVKTSDYMDRRGYMAILSLLHDFAILRVVTMDPSQLFGAWLNDTTFLGGSLEISLDRFATTVQIEAYEVPEIHSPVNQSNQLPVVDESSGRPLFTFSSETASLIKFLTVAAVPKTIQHATQTLDNRDIKGSDAKQDVDFDTNGITVDKEHDEINFGLGLNISLSEHKLDLDTNCNKYTNSQVLGSLDTVACPLEMCDNCGKDPCKCCDRSRDKYTYNKGYQLSSPEICRKSDTKYDIVDVAKSETFESDQQLFNKKLQSSDSDPDTDMELDTPLSKKSLQRPQTLPSSSNLTLEYCDHTAASSSKDALAASSSKGSLHNSNLIFVTGEFAVALHQLGFKNVPPYTKESILARGVTPMDEDNPEGFMVVNYSNNDIHIVRRQQETDKPDNLIDLFGHVTGLCLTADQRYLFINCRPWIGSIDRSDPWATPDLSPHIEVRIIDLLTLKDLGRRYIGHRGHSPSNMCCFVFLDVSEDYVASGSEDAKGYLWDRHYQSLLGNLHHESGVVNAVGFNPNNQEYLVTVSDDSTVKIWRSKHQVKLLNIVVKDENAEDI